MGLILYGTRCFTKFEGYYGEKEECPHCHKIYKSAYVKNNKWFHIDYLPIIPIKKTYFKMCPICSYGTELNSKEGKKEMLNSTDSSQQKLETYVKHVLIKKPTGMMSVDTSYELWVKDLITGEEICVASDLTKSTIKEMKKVRGLKEIKIIDV